MHKNPPLGAPLQAILEKMVAGDQDSFEEILSFYEGPIFNHLIHLTGSHDVAADLLQETFIRLYNKRSQIDTKGNVKNWLYKVATNIAYDFFRKKKREKLISIDDENLPETIERQLSYTNVEREITAIDLEKALLEIRPQYKNILLLYYKEGFTYEELANILELPLNTIKTHIRRARNDLYDLLNETYG